MAGVEDEVLVRRVAAGDERALDGLYDRYAPLVYGAGTRYLGDRGMAEDLVQEVFVSVWRNAGSFDPSRASFATWVYRTVDGGPPPEPETPDPTGQLSRSFDVAAALARLSATHREVLVLAYFEGLSQREISTRTDTPLGTVKSRTTAAMRALREAMSPEPEGW